MDSMIISNCRTAQIGATLPPDRKCALLSSMHRETEASLHTGARPAFRAVSVAAQKKQKLMWEALREATDEEMEKDPTVCVMGGHCAQLPSAIRLPKHSNRGKDNIAYDSPCR